MLPTFRRSDGVNDIDVFRNLDNTFEKLFKIFDKDARTYGYSPMSGLSSAFIPPIDVSVTDNNVHVYFECPGVKKEDLSVAIDNHVLIVQGEKKKCKVENEAKCCDQVIGERVYGSFRREISLPENVDVENIKVSFEDGVLKAIVPKIEQESKVRKLEIQ